MLAIIDHRVSKTVTSNLQNYVDDIFLFKSHNITYNSISGHPDIFIYQDSKNLIIAPNSPQDLIEYLDKNQIEYQFGKSSIGKSLKNSTYYNCLSTNKHFFHKDKFTDEKIRILNANKTFINIPQAYTRCSMLAIQEEYFITSDKGIEKILNKTGLDVFYFSPENILIEDHNNGFLGGTAGKIQNRIFFLGNILKHKDGEKLEYFLTKLNIEIICLSNDYLYDGGGLFFI